MMTTANRANDTAQATQLNGTSRSMRPTIYHRPTATVRENAARPAAGTDTANEDTETAKPEKDTEN